MERELREDILEAMLSCPGPDGGSSQESLANILGRTASDLDPALSTLENTGCISRGEDRLFTLSDKGREVAQGVATRHRVLECFLSTILGMAPGDASREACALEHTVSDTVIDRIGDFIGERDTGRRIHRRVRGAAAPGEGAPGGTQQGTVTQYSRLRDAPLNIPVRVRVVEGGNCLHRLLDLGIVPGEEITLTSRLPNGAVVIEVKGAAIALSPEVASVIEVEIPG